MRADKIGLYVHVPFCFKKCNYCDFSSYAGLNPEVREAYINKLVSEISSYKRAEKIKVDTVFFGGGTPSLLSPLEFQKIAEEIYNSFDVSEKAEFTLEANPKTVTREKLSAYKSFGVNRVSLGLQSIHENELKILGRIHNFEDFKSAYEDVAAVGIENISVDVMYGIPEQTKESFAKTLDEVTALSPNHLSAYGLILEEDTPLYENRASYKFPSEDEECDMYYLACDKLGKIGYSHYEISNYALRGFESKHNLKYWTDSEYVGVGVAAYSYYNGVRFGNSRNIKEYLSADMKEYITESKITPEDEAYEYAMLALRLSRGFSLPEYKERFGVDFTDGRSQKLKLYIKGGYLNLSDERISLTEKGFYVSNTILTDLL